MSVSGPHGISIKEQNLVVIITRQITEKIFPWNFAESSVNHGYNVIFVFFTIIYKQIRYKIANNTKKLIKFILRWYFIELFCIFYQFCKKYKNWRYIRNLPNFSVTISLETKGAKVWAQCGQLGEVCYPI